MKTKFFAIILTISMLFSTGTIVFAQPIDSSDITDTIVNNGGVIIDSTEGVDTVLTDENSENVIDANGIGNNISDISSATSIQNAASTAGLAGKSVSAIDTASSDLARGVYDDGAVDFTTGEQHTYTQEVLRDSPFYVYGGTTVVFFGLTYMDGGVDYDGNGVADAVENAGLGFYYNSVDRGGFVPFTDYKGDICTNMEAALLYSYAYTEELLTCYIGSHVQFSRYDIMFAALAGHSFGYYAFDMRETYYVKDDGEYWGKDSFAAYITVNKDAESYFIPARFGSLISGNYSPRAFAVISRSPSFIYPTSLDDNYYTQKYSHVEENRGELIHIHTDTGYHLYADNFVQINNAWGNMPYDMGTSSNEHYRTMYNNPIAVVIDNGGLFIMNGCVIKDLYTEGNGTAFKGTGILLTTTRGKTYPLNEDIGGAVELHGTSIIQQFAVGIDSDYGVTRVKNGSWNINNNTLSVNLAHGTYIGKWCASLAHQQPISVFLEDAKLWSSGDIILASGYRTNDVQGQPDIKTPVFESDMDFVHITNSFDTSYGFTVEFFNNNGNEIDPFPVIRLTLATVYNENLKTWYKSLYEASVDPNLADGHTIIFFGGTVENRTVLLEHSVTIRSSYKNEMPYAGTGAAAPHVDERAGNDTVVYWLSNDRTNCIKVISGKTVVFAPADETDRDYGTITFDANKLSRFLENFGTVTMYNNISMLNGALVYGGCINNEGTLTINGVTIADSTAGNGAGGAIASKGTVTLEDVVINNCDAGYGAAIYVDSVSARSKLTMTDCTISNCTASDIGGAVYNSSGSIFTMTNCNITNCSAVSQAGGVYNGNLKVFNGDSKESYYAQFTMENGSITNCSALSGGAVFQNGEFYLSGATTFSGNTTEDVFLCSDAYRDVGKGTYVITKAGSFDFPAGQVVSVTLGYSDSNIYDGRNVVESGVGTVTSADLSLFTLTNLTGYNQDKFSKLDFVYTAADATPTKGAKPVLELDVVAYIAKGDLTITKKVDILYDEDQAFLFHVVGQSGTVVEGFDMIIAVYVDPNTLTGSATIEGLLAGNYTVTELIDQCWRYDPNNVSVSLNGANPYGATSIFAVVSDKQNMSVAFTNKLKTNKWLSDSAYCINTFNKQESN